MRPSLCSSFPHVALSVPLMSKFVLSIACWTLLICPAAADSLELANPKEIGLSPERLKKISEMLEEQVEQQKISGAVAAIARHGRIGYLQAVGGRAEAPMQKDAIFRIASMTKAITSAAVMSLVEDGKIELDASISKYLPDFANPRVFVSLENDSPETRPATREATITDLLTHRSGLAYGWFGPEKVDSAYKSRNLPDLFIPIQESLEERIGRASDAPLKFDPGTNWEYSLSTDVLGRIVEVASGLTLEKFFYERFFRPLEMHDTHFALPKSKQNRLARLFTPNGEGIREVGSEPITAGFLKFSADYCLESNSFYSGGGGLVSTTTDYLRFLQMLLNEGELDGKRVLQPETVRLMTQNHIGDLQLPFPGHGDGFGFGFGVLTDRGKDGDDASVGTFSWGGIFNTYYWVDPQEELIGVIMTQIFPYDHLNLRSEFKRLTYESIDDSGFEHVYWYEQGLENGNPHFNNRQLRVNAPEVSTHPKYASRSEPRSSGVARILIEQDLRQIRRVDLATEIWGGHPGTANKLISVNGRASFSIPEVGTESKHCTHQYPSFNLQPNALVNGHNALQFSCEQGDTFWGHYIVDNVCLKVGLKPECEELISAGLANFEASVDAIPTFDGFSVQLSVPGEVLNQISAVHYQARYFGYDENGNGQGTDWHGMTKDRVPYGVVGSSNKPPFTVSWDTSLLPAQKNVAIRAVLEFKGHPALRYRTQATSGLAIPQREGSVVKMFQPTDLPNPFWSRDNQLRECAIEIDVDPSSIEEAELHVVAWTGGAGKVKDYFQINGHHFPIAEGSEHETVYSKLLVDPNILKKGRNSISLLSDTEHHGIEIMSPGPALMVRHVVSDETSSAAEDSGDTNTKGKASSRLVTFTENEKDKSAGGIDCYKIETANATYYLDKVGAGLSSLIDKDGNDWLGFKPDKGSGAAGEYRGFPNAVFQEAGSYFHARNSGTDPCITIVESVTPERVEISATSDNGLWAGTYTFTADACTFTMTRKPKGHNFWILYEGTPGGQYNDSDWWMTSHLRQKSPLTKEHTADIDGAEWMAFGDQKLRRMLVVMNHAADAHPDRFYQMQKKMTVFGFGRDGMKKYLSQVPQSFSIGIVEADTPETADQFFSTVVQQLSTKRDGDSKTSSLGKRAILEQFALRNAGNPDAGKKLFFDDERTRCATCHQVGKEGGKVGPDLTKIGGKFDRPHLIESLLLPSAQIVEGYRTTLIITEDDSTHSGIVKAETADEIKLVDANNKQHRIAKDVIFARKEAEVSLMPTGLADLLSEREFADLVAYLESLRTGNAKFGSGIRGPIELPPGFNVSTVATGLSGATALETTRDGRIFVCEQDGKLRVIQDGKLLDEPFVTIPVEHNWERGLIGVTVAPNFPEDPHVYVVYVTDKPYTHHRVSRFVADGNHAVPGSEEILLRGDDQSLFGGNVPAGHQGGAIHFGLDGKLYIGLGEQTAKTPSQDFAALQGKILRLNPDGSIPADNPFLDKTSGKYQSIWAIGCRNPFTFAVAPEDGNILINDVGGKYEEINPGVAGANYGWPTIDHGPTDESGITGPIHIYPQASISGGDFAPSSSTWPEEYQNRYLFADFVHGWINMIDLDSPVSAETFANGFRRPVDMRFASDGSLYVLLRNAWVVDGKFEGGTGSLMKIEYIAPK